MINVLVNFHLLRFKYNILGKICEKSVRLTSKKYLVTSAIQHRTVYLWNHSKRLINYKENTRPICISLKKFQKSAEINHNDEKQSSLIYTGALTHKVKGIKVFTFITSCGGLVIQPLLVQKLLSGNNLLLEGALLCCTGFFTFFTPFIIHLFTKKYVTEMWYNSSTNTYTATVLSFFLQKINITFKIEDVKIPSMLPIFSTVIVKGKPMFIVSECFLEMEHYIKMMGYDKPIDVIFEEVMNDKKKTKNKLKSEI